MAEQWGRNTGDGEVKSETEVSPEVRDQFEREKLVGAFWAFQFGERNGIPREELAAFIRSTVEEKRSRGEYAAAARLLQTIGVGTPEEIRAAAEAPASIIGEQTAGDVEGEEEEFEDLVLPADATFGALDEAFARLGEGFREGFKATLSSVLKQGEVETILDLMVRQPSTERVREVFARYGLTEEEVAYYFFIRFSKE